jgi:uncharacterized protein DUF4435
MTLPKKKIDEVRTRLIRERTVREIYVEGIFDRDLYRWVLKHLNIADVRVYPISTLDVPQDLLDDQGLTSGERQRVITTARLFENDVAIHRQLLLLIDADVDYLLDQANYSPPLLGTAGTSAELILWRKEVLQKFLSMVLGCEQPERVAENLMAYVEPIVSSVCIFRAAKKLLGAGWKLIDIADAVGKQAQFSFEEYCNKVGDKNGARKQMSEDLPGALKIIRERASGLEAAKKLHGHDLVALMGKRLRIDGYTQKSLNDCNELSRVLMSSLEWDFVRNDETIAKINAKFEKEARQVLPPD